jgi:hypothetical protein
MYNPVTVIYRSMNKDGKRPLNNAIITLLAAKVRIL